MDSNGTKYTPRRAYLGGYLIELRPIGKAGPFGCDPCVDCGKRPAEGEPVFMLSSCLLCGPCSDRAARAAIERAEGGKDA